MRTVILTLGSLALVALLMGTATIFFGLFNVSARGGHWPLVNWVLHTTYQHSVALRAPPESDVPTLDDDQLVSLGARHYHQACAACHGEPDGKQLHTMLSMLPPPPPIKEAVSDWEPNELFWIVKNGVKMSGMPHWPALDRDDDIWPVVAFLSRLPDLDNTRYTALLNGDNTTPDTAATPDSHPAVSYNCTLCHGMSGTTENAHVPRLDILSREYLSATLVAYRDRQRASGIMQQAASVLDDETIDLLANYYSGTPTESAVPGISVDDPSQTDHTAADSSVERGRLLATGVAGLETDEQRLPSGAEIPACNACHGPWTEPLSPRYPTLASQPEAYLLSQLKLWNAGNRGGTDRANLMHKAIPELELEQMKDLSAYYSSLPGAD